LCCVSGTEQQLMPACNVLFWNQVIQGESIYLFCALAFDSLTLRRAHFLFFGALTFSFLVISIRAKLSQGEGKIKMASVFCS
jgi:hypothetical protein